MLKKILELIYPSFCTSCQKLISSSMVLCSICMSTVKPVVSLFVPLTKRKSLKVFAAGAYQDPLKRLVLKKFSSNMIASHQLARLMLQALPAHECNADVIIPIPLHWTRYAWRGYNQAVAIAQTMSRMINIPMLKMLKRKKRTKFQFSLGKNLREKNLENAFIIRKKFLNNENNYIKNKRIILIDDLYTTGSTLKSAAKKLLELQPASITALVGCRSLG